MKGDFLMTKLIRAIALLGFLIIIGANEFDVRSLFGLLMIPLFFIGTPWYKYFSKEEIK